jgi:hypothetical protein
MNFLKVMMISVFFSINIMGASSPLPMSPRRAAHMRLLASDERKVAWGESKLEDRKKSQSRAVRRGPLEEEAANIFDGPAFIEAAYQGDINAMKKIENDILEKAKIEKEAIGEYFNLEVSTSLPINDLIVGRKIDREGTALTFAFLNGKMEAVHYLLSAGAFPYVDCNKDVAWLYAMKRNDASLLKKLKATTKKHISLQISSSNGHIDCTLIKDGCVIL